MAAAGLKDILYYSAAELRPPVFSLFDVAPRCFGKSRTRSAGLQECRGSGKTTDRGRVGRGGERSQTVKLARLARDQGLITTLEEYLHAMVCVFHPPFFARPLVRPSQFKRLFFFSLSPRPFAPFSSSCPLSPLPSRLFSSTLRPSYFRLAIFNMSFSPGNTFLFVDLFSLASNVLFLGVEINWQKFTNGIYACASGERILSSEEREIKNKFTRITFAWESRKHRNPWLAEIKEDLRSLVAE